MPKPDSKDKKDNPNKDYGWSGDGFQHKSGDSEMCTMWKARYNNTVGSSFASNASDNISDNTDLANGHALDQAYKQIKKLCPKQ